MGLLEHRRLLVAWDFAVEEQRLAAARFLPAPARSAAGWSSSQRLPAGLRRLERLACPSAGEREERRGESAGEGEGVTGCCSLELLLPAGAAGRSSVWQLLPSPEEKIEERERGWGEAAGERRGRKKSE
ncbi:hypothetical protein RDI58_019920 [Solanum bulbocastanum]|uniref:Uncharacterized protein n=1 Tax=Solanum bulbocastanum TaxID=147425 RepID=A0AAN8Y7F2_SOLBU